MNREEYNKELAEISAETRRKKQKLARMYALSNNPFSVGETVEDHIGKGIIEKIDVCISYLNYLPSCTYRCINLTKAGKQSKRDPKRTIYQSNLITGDT